MRCSLGPHTRISGLSRSISLIAMRLRQRDEVEKKGELVLGTADVTVCATGSRMEARNELKSLRTLL